MPRTWLDWSRRITPWLFYTASVLFFLACALQYLRGGGFNAENFFTGAILAVVPALLQWAEESFGP